MAPDVARWWRKVLRRLDSDNGAPVVVPVEPGRRDEARRRWLLTRTTGTADADG